MFSLFLTRPYHIYPEHFEYTARVTWDHSVVLLRLFFKSLMLIAILPLYEEARVGHKKKKSFLCSEKGRRAYDIRTRKKVNK